MSDDVKKTEVTETTSVEEPKLADPKEEHRVDLDQPTVEKTETTVTETTEASE